MYSSNLENQLIVIDIADALRDYCSIQLDLDDTKVKAASIIAQRLDIGRVIGNDNILRCIEPATREDEALRELVIPALCYFTYSRLLTLFQGTLTESGYSTEPGADEKNMAKSVATDIKTVGEAFLTDVVDFLKAENPNTGADEARLTPRVRVFGGEERRGSN